MLAALLSAGVVAFLSFSNRHLAVGTSTEAVSIALLARSQIVGSFKNEMAAGSAPLSDSKKRELIQVEGVEGPLTLLFPATPWAAVPSCAHKLVPPNLIKWSSRYVPFYTESVPLTSAPNYPLSSSFPPGAPAAPVSTLDRSANGKAISLKRWNATWLLPKKTPTSTDPTPVGLPVPDWVCVTARGQQRNSLSTQRWDPIVGRYAYLVFDEGGLLDASVAGFDSGLDPSVVAAKASARLADLRPVLEAGGLTQAEATACNNAFVRWRDPAFFDQSGSVDSNVVRSLGPARPSVLFPGNRALVSRQALIRLIHDRLPGKLSARQNALQYLGTFSRSLAQPHLFHASAGGTPPIAPSEEGGNDGAGWNARHPHLAQRLNPPFAVVRVKNPFERADGTRALPGEPLVKKRFSLTQLDFLKRDAVATAGSPIEKLFGFSRAIPDEPWLYRGGKGRILTLNEVAALGERAAREPDFVELLKASILAGSIAKNSGIPLLPSDDSLDEAVLQIALNIMDQADVDAFPTRAKLKAGQGRVLSGIENLPYLSGISTRVGVVQEALPSSLLRSPDGKSPVPYYSRTRVTNPGEAVLWQAFQFWNPHELSEVLAKQPRPSEFRLSVQATNRFGVQLVQKRPMPVHSGTLVPGASPEPDPGPEITGEQFRFDLPMPAVAAFYMPEWVDSPEVPQGINARLGANNLLPPTGMPDVRKKPIFGVGLARGTQVFTSGTPPNEYAVLPSIFQPEPAPHLYYRLEYNLHGEGEVPVWITYDEKLAGPLAGVDAAGTAFLECWPDPRSRRFGAFGSAQDQTEIQVRERFFKNTGDFPGDYVDPDGVTRRGAGASGNTASPLGMGGRPHRLDRPFRSVGELAYVFAGTPWRHLDFATPESGFGGLLEAFCVGENFSPDALEVGRVNLNTKNVPVLQAVLAGADLGPGDFGPQPLPATGAFSARSLAEGLVSRTSSRKQGAGPLQTLSDLVGRRGADGKYSGVASDLPLLFARAPNGGTSPERHTLARTLAACGDTRVWNLLFDIIAQAGRFPPGSEKRGDLRNFVVEAEHRIWVHVAIDRLTGEVLDEQIEEVLE